VTCGAPRGAPGSLTLGAQGTLGPRGAPA
jgi:hypothetical protein